MAHSTYDKTLSGLIRERSPLLFWASIALGLLAGLCYSFIMPFLLQGIGYSGVVDAGRDSTAWLRSHAGIVYALLCLTIFIAKAGSLISITICVKDLTADLRIDLCRKINQVGVRDIEKLGMARITNVLVEDIGAVGFAAVCQPMIGVQIVTVTGMLCYLAWLDWRVFLCVVAAIGVGFFVHRWPLRAAFRYFGQSRELRDQVQSGVRGVVFGAYELKLNRDKAHAFMTEEIARPERAAAAIDKRADIYLHCANTFVDLFSLVVIGLVALPLPRFVPAASASTYAVVMVLLYILMPIMVALTLLPNLQRGKVALQRIRELDALIEEPQAASCEIPQWSRYQVRNLQYRYHNAQGDQAGFALQPITLSFTKGEVVFVVGGNGSGKSTLSKLLSLHYEPNDGDIYFDEERVTPRNIASAREQIAVIYSSYYLFERLYGRHDSALQGRVDEYLRSFGLDHRTQFRDGRFSTTQLSDGQRRRLALLVALLDDREIYVFDEWAADQDPEFREVFYTKILGEMRERGKLVIVITHDDRYFGIADRVVVMEYGGVREIRVRTESRTSAESGAMLSAQASSDRGAELVTA